MRILVTGCAGFIGSRLCSLLLDKGFEILGVDDFNDFYSPKIKQTNIATLKKSSSFKLCEGDIRDFDLMRKICSDFQPERIAHLAARAGVRPSIKNPRLYASVNVSGTLSLLEAAKAVELEHFVFASSSSIYGECKNPPFREDEANLRAVSPYAASKAAGEQFCSSYSSLTGMRAICLRYFTVFGPGQRPDLAIAKFIDLIRKGVPIPRYGDGDTGRDYTYVDDICDGTMAALFYDKSEFEIINLGGSQPVSLNELIAKIEKVLGKKAIIDALPPQSGDVPFTFADISKAKRLLNYVPKTSLEAGLKEYLRSLRD